ncbi:hypothetical protein SDC9_176884 [bioreactor metagenome]|uniref:Uncharacterized protein n=1 Tax=bioreactor metagenome TaxID=1076179 RepID=A0A645GR89_9ZZZZ
MKKVVFGLTVLVILAIVAFNVNLDTKKTDKVSLLALTNNVEALADEESGGSSWICSTYTSDVYEQSQDCYEHGFVLGSRWITRDCNNGFLSWCYPGYVTEYYDCEGNLTRTVDMTEMSGCL